MEGGGRGARSEEGGQTNRTTTSRTLSSAGNDDDFTVTMLQRVTMDLQAAGSRSARRRGEGGGRGPGRKTRYAIAIQPHNVEFHGVMLSL